MFLKIPFLIYLMIFFNKFSPCFGDTENNICGISVKPANPLLFGGTKTARGEFPWLVAIYQKKRKEGIEFICGASLISKKLVLTAAHCVKIYGVDVSIEKFVLFIGRHNIDDWSEDGVISPKINNIFVHPDYKNNKPETYDADIAVIILEHEVKYTQYIRSVCLWENSTKITDIESKEGITIGWGRDENGTLSSVPKKIEIPIVSEGECLRSDAGYLYITSNRTFCAGRKDGSGSCHGDSGGPFLMKINGRWYLRGIVSVGLLDFETLNCNTRLFTVYTDVAQFLPWITRYLTPHTSTHISTTSTSIKPFIKTSSIPAVPTYQNYSRQDVNNNICGISTVQLNPLIEGGNKTKRGEFPWLVAIYAKSTKDFATGSLISNKVVLTAAAPCYDFSNEIEMSIQEIILYIGLGFELSNIEDYYYDGVVSPKLNKIVVHPDFKQDIPENLDANIGLILLKQEVKFTPFIQPVCLWNRNLNRADSEKHVGTVVGWGRGKTDSLPIHSLPIKIVMPIRPDGSCYGTHRFFSDLAFNRIFCDVSKYGTGLCSRLLGSPFLLKRNGRWYIKGFISAWLHSDEERCVSLLTDVAKFLPWIQTHLRL